MAIIIDGKKLAVEIIQDLKKEREKIKEKIKLGVILVGDSASALSFIKRKKEVAKKLAIDFRVYLYPSTIKSKDLRKEVSKICRIPEMKGVVVQLPLPEKINTPTVLNAILEDKDPDCLSERNLAKFYNNRSIIKPPTVSAIDFLLKKYRVNLKNKNILIIGAGYLTGKPLAVYFLNQKISFTVLEKDYKNQDKILKNADIIFSGTGKPNLIKGKSLKKGIIIFDLSFNFYHKKIVGDCEKESVIKKASLYSPVPGGIGPLTVAFLYSNLLTLIKNKNHKNINKKGT
jgi:methylenetetrahydrofolate dehydrogenase (NADP+)/methenyltetrahydrofolate cyclohydrolase